MMPYHDSGNYLGGNLIFVVGSPRSGTSWLQRLIASHPKVKTGQESDLFDGYVGPQLRYWRQFVNPGSSGRNMVGMACYHSEEQYIQILTNYMMSLLNPMIGPLKSDEYFLEKTPSHALFLPEIVRLLPNAKIIHILRDGRDVVASLLKASKTWGASWAPNHPFKAAMLWKRHVEAVMQARPLMQDDNFLEIHYESLMVNTAEVLKKIFLFLDLTCPLNFIRDTVDNNTLSSSKRNAGMQIPLYGEAQKHIGDFVREPNGFWGDGNKISWKQKLSTIQKLWVWLAIKNTMTKVGYNYNYPF